MPRRESRYREHPACTNCSGAGRVGLQILRGSFSVNMLRDARVVNRSATPATKKVCSASTHLDSTAASDARRLRKSATNNDLVAGVPDSTMSASTATKGQPRLLPRLVPHFNPQVRLRYLSLPVCQLGFLPPSRVSHRLSLWPMTPALRQYRSLPFCQSGFLPPSRVSHCLFAQPTTPFFLRFLVPVLPRVSITL